MKVIYFNAPGRVYVLENRDLPPVLLCGFDQAENDEAPPDESIAPPRFWEILMGIAEDHNCRFDYRGFYYIANRHGTTISWAQVLRIDTHEHGRDLLADALNAVIAYEGASK